MLPGNAGQPAPTLVVKDSACDPRKADAAARELEEETGYRAERIENLGEYYSSPGMVSESFFFVRALDLVKTGDGGGVDGENITVHRVPVADVPAFIAKKRAEGCAMDAKLLLLMGLV